MTIGARKHDDWGAQGRPGLNDTTASTAHGWTLDARKRRLLCDGQPVPLGGRAFDLLAALAAQPGELVEAELLVQRIWPGRVVEDNNLQVQVSVLRKLLGAEAIATVRGRGYQLVLELGTAPAADAAAAPAMPAAADIPSRVLGNLPLQATPLIGREEVLQTLRRLLQQHRLVTVTGPGGVGKTRLALAALAPSTAAPPPAAGTWLVELAGLADSTPVAEAVARALGFSLAGLGAADDELLDLLRQRALLLLLDNCEHRADEACRLLARLAQAAPQLQVLATSQVRLQFPGEQLLRLAPLPSPHEAQSAAEQRANPAVALFGARVAALDPGFDLAREGEPALADVTAICRALDGLPLALELAAARVPLLGLAGLRERLGQPLALLQAGAPAGTPARLRTLQAALEWSYALLGADEQRAFRRLGLSSGRLSLPLAQALLADDEPAAAAGSDEPGPAAAALELLQGLLDRSLLAPLPAAEDAPAGTPPRVRLLDSARLFAHRKLCARGEADAALARLVRALLRQFTRPPGADEFLGRLAELPARAADLDNLRVALDGLAQQPTLADLHVELAGTSAWVWSRLGLRAEGARRCRQALQRVNAQTPPALEARLQLAWARAVNRRGAPGDLQAAARAAELFEALGDPRGQFRALMVLAMLYALTGDEPRCMGTLEQLSDRFDPQWGQVLWAGHFWTVIFCLPQLDHLEHVRAQMNLGRQLMANMDDEMRLPALATIAQGHALLGEPAEAIQAAREAAALARQRKAWGRLGMVLSDLSTYLAEAGQTDEAQALAREAIDLRAADGTLGTLLDQLAWQACLRGRHAPAAVALARADLHHQHRQGRRESALRNAHRRASEAVAEALTPEQQALYRQRGALLGDDEAARQTLD